MPELHDVAVENVPAFRAPKIAVGVCSKRSGLYALTRALEREVPAHGMVYLMHVQSPIKWIPNALGGRFPVEQAHPKIVQRVKNQRSLEAEKLVNQYREMCDRKKIKSEVCYFESDSVQKELVDQILKLGITKLVLGTSQSVLSRAFKVESVSTYVAKHAPGFCEVLVVNREKPCYVKKGTQTSALVCSSRSSASEASISSESETNMGSDEGASRTSNAIQNGDRRTWSGVTEVIISPSHSPGASLDFLPTHPEWRLPHSISSHGANPDLSQVSMNVGALSIVETPATQRPSFAHEYGLLSPNTSFANGSAVVVPEGDLLQNQLNEAADTAQREAERRTNFLMKAQEVVEHERRRLEALSKAEMAMLQATKDAKRCEEAMWALELAQKDHECLRRQLAEEVERHQKTQMELETQKRMANAYAIEAALAKQQAEAERRRCEETTVKLDDLSRRLEIECQLRKEAEDKASLEAVAKLDALANLRRERQRYSEYSYEELQSATNGFHEENKLGKGGYGPVYKGKLCHTSVAIKVLAQERSHGREEFQREVEVLSRIHHPHMLMLLGACPEKGCIVYEYMANGSLEDRLNCKDGTPPLPWYARFRICFEVSTALLFLHSQSQPIVHRDLKPGNILLDHHFVSKIGDVGLARLVPDNLTFSVTEYKDTVPVGTFAYIDPDYLRTGIVSRESDVYSLGIVMLQLLTGKPALGIAHLVEKAEREGNLKEVLDKSAGDWSLEEARKLACISLKCTEFKRRNRPKLEMDIIPILESIQNVAELAAANMASVRPSSSGTRPVVPSFFFCPILQEIMEDPHMAADGFTYEHYAIKVWLQANNTSPMTNLRLDHKNLTRNHTLRSAIREWYDNGLI